ncbi:hypothetical protein B0H21DRAFT_464688 [Amylocystis lapponica]|nr:hypothetical protein B0H21DRAFT_464688 [Amylocystis lapponica]
MMILPFHEVVEPWQLVPVHASRFTLPPEYCREILEGKRNIQINYSAEHRTEQVPKHVTPVCTDTSLGPRATSIHSHYKQQEDTGIGLGLMLLEHPLSSLDILSPLQQLDSTEVDVPTGDDIEHLGSDSREAEVPRWADDALRYEHRMPLTRPVELPEVISVYDEVECPYTPIDVVSSDGRW